MSPNVDARRVVAPNSSCVTSCNRTHLYNNTIYIHIGAPSFESNIVTEFTRSVKTKHAVSGLVVLLVGVVLIVTSAHTSAAHVPSELF